MQKRNVLGTILFLALFLGSSVTAMAGGVTYKDGDKYVKIGGRIQVQYHGEDPDGGDYEDEVFFRRLRPYIEGSIHKDWKGKFQFDLGKAKDGNEVAIKDAYLQYSGIKNIKVTVGNVLFPFSLETLTSSKKQQLVERTFVGDHNFGAPDRQLGVYVDGFAADKKFAWSLGLAMAGLDPSNSKLDFDSLAVRDSDYLEGIMYGARVEFHPLGYLKKSQGDFKRETKLSFGLAAFSWNNDDDNNGGTSADKVVDSVYGINLDAALRTAGLSLDGQVNFLNSELADGTVTSGLYENGKTDLFSYALEGGYMVVPETLEVVAGYEGLDADNYDVVWTRYSVGLNYFFKKQDIKVQATYRINKDEGGVDGNDVNEIFVQTQYVF